MRPLDIAAHRWADYRPPSLCRADLGIGEALAAIGLGSAGAAGAGAGTAAAVLGGAGETALLSSAGIATGAAAGLPAAAAAGSILPSLSTVGTIAGLAGTGLQAIGQANQASYEQEVAKSQADALAQKSNEDAAAAQRQQALVERRTGLITSRARALAADSGTDASSPDVVTNQGRIAQQGEYSALSSLYEGLAQSRADQYQGSIDLFRGQEAAAAAPLAIGGTVLSGLSSFADRRTRLKYFTSDPSSATGFLGFGGA